MHGVAVCGVGGVRARLVPVVLGVRRPWVARSLARVRKGEPEVGEEVRVEFELTFGYGRGWVGRRFGSTVLFGGRTL